MSSFETNGITAKGNNLLAKVQAGITKLNYTKAVVGDGQLGQGQAIIALTNLISPRHTYNINRLAATPGDPAFATVGFVYSNQGITSGYYLREIGIFAQDPDEGEILYWYGNAGATADFIAPGDGSGTDVIEKKFDIGLYVGQASDVSAIIDGSLVFPTYEEFDAAIAAARAYTDQKFSSIVIESATTSRSGVVKLNSSTNSTSEVEAATPKAVKDVNDSLTAHGNVNSGAHGATSAATANRIMQRDVNGRAKIAVPSAADDIARLDTITGITGALSGLSTSAKASLVAAINELFNSGVSAKQAVVDAINAMGGSASTNDTWATLATKIQTLSMYTSETLSLPTLNTSDYYNNGSNYRKDERIIKTFPAGPKKMVSIEQSRTTSTGNSVDIRLSTSVLSSSGNSAVRCSLVLEDDGGRGIYFLDIAGNSSSDYRLLNGYADFVTRKFSRNYFDTVRNHEFQPLLDIPSNFNANGALTLKFVFEWGNAVGYTYTARFSSQFIGMIRQA